MDVNIVELEDQKEYAILEEKAMGELTYLLLQEVNDHDNVCIRKRVSQNDVNYIVQLINEDELQRAIKLFI